MSASGDWIGREFERASARYEATPGHARLIVTKPPLSGRTSSKPDVRPQSYLIQSQLYRMNMACAHIYRAFGCYPYLVGSVLRTPHFRDVDLRLPMDEARGGTDFTAEGDRLTLINCALSEWLAIATGLPIDFQFQDAAEWASYDSEVRNPMGLLDTAFRAAGGVQG